MSYDIYGVDDYEEMSRLKDEAKSEYQRQLREDSYEEINEDEDCDDGCPICGSHRCSGYCL